MKLQTRLAVLVCKASGAVLRKLGRGGTNLPGKLALKIDKNILGELSRGVKVTVVTGTNGKTTTSRMIEQAFADAGLKYFSNKSGANLLTGIIAVFAIIIRKELLIPILCGIFLVENLSVLMQTFYFKYTKKKYGEGRRIFKMAPLHHHFQKAGNAGIQALIQKPFNVVPESKIVVRFWLIGIILAVITIVTLKMR